MQRTALVVIVIAAIIVTTLTVSLQATAQNYNIPSWIKNNAKWWSDGQISDGDFVKGIEYLIDNGVMQVGQKSISEEPENVLNVPVAEDFDLPNGLAVEYNVMFVTSDDNCTWEEFGKMHFYNEVTYYYLLAWGLEPTYIDPLCIPNSDYAELPDEYFGHDLTILMVDEIITQKHLVEDSHAWGYFDPDESVIVSGELTDMMTEAGLLTEEDIASEWTLTHELAHFVLYYTGDSAYGFNEGDSDWVHDIEDWNEYCILQDPNDPTCGEIYSTLEVNGMEVIVMKPYVFYYYE
ncbi:MAG: hypothetical protein ACREAK_09505 [Nitrosarchaeum sp.]